jgi:hypothetical protein
MVLLFNEGKNRENHPPDLHRHEPKFDSCLPPLEVVTPENRSGFRASESPAMLICLGFWIVTKLAWYKINLIGPKWGSYDKQT